MYRFRPQRRGARTTWTLAVIMAVCLAAGCSKDEPKPIAEGTTSTTAAQTTSSTDGQAGTSTTTTTTGVPPTTEANGGTSTTTVKPSGTEQLIISRYKAFWDARAAANAAPPNPDDPALRELATGQQLVTVIAETKDRRDQGLAIRAAKPSVAERRVTVVKLGADTAELNDCSVNDGVVYRIADGQVVDAAVVTRNVRATMRKVDGVWRLETASVFQTWKGVAGCALADA